MTRTLHAWTRGVQRPEDINAAFAEAVNARDVHGLVALYVPPALAIIVANEEIENDLLFGCPGDSGSRDRAMLSIDRMLAGVG